MRTSQYFTPAQEGPPAHAHAYADVYAIWQCDGGGEEEAIRRTVWYAIVVADACRTVWYAIVMAYACRTVWYAIVVAYACAFQRQSQSAPTPPVGSQHVCQPTVKLHIIITPSMDFLWGRGSTGAQGAASTIPAAGICLAQGSGHG